MKNGFFGPMFALFLERCIVDTLSFVKTQGINDNDFQDLMMEDVGEKYPNMTMRDLVHQFHDEVNEYVM